MRMVERDRPQRVGERLAHREPLVIGEQVQATTCGRASPFAFTTIRLDAHIIASGETWRMSQQASLISGTSAVASIVGNRTR